MSIRPVVSVEDAAALCIAHFAVRPFHVPLELRSYDDRNFLIKDGGGRQYVLKIHNHRESSPDAIQLQNEMLQHVGRHGLPVPEPCPTTSGALAGFVKLPVDGGARAEHAIRLLTYLQGMLLADAPKAPALFTAIGQCLGRVDAALASFLPSVAAPSTPGPWDLRSAAATVSAHLGRFAAADEREVLLWVLEQHDRWVAPAGLQLRMSYIHGDATEDNILVDPASRAVTGLIDWGDSCKSYVVAEVAIALVEAMSLQSTEEGDLLTAARALLAGYQAEMQLTQLELGVLPALAACRIAQSLVISTAAAQQDPSNAAYLTHSHATSWRLLKFLRITPPDLLQQQMIACSI